MPKHPKPPYSGPYVGILPNVRVCDLCIPVEMAMSQAAHVWHEITHRSYLAEFIMQQFLLRQTGIDWSNPTDGFSRCLIGFCFGSRPTARSCLVWHSDHKFCTPYSSFTANFHMYQRSLCRPMHTWILKNPSKLHADARRAGGLGGHSKKDGKPGIHATDTRITLILKMKKKCAEGFHRLPANIQ